MKNKSLLIIVVLAAISLIGLYSYFNIYPSYKRQSLLLKQQDVRPIFMEMLNKLTPYAGSAVLSFEDPAWVYTKYTKDSTNFRFFDVNTYEWHARQGSVKATFETVDLSKINLGAISEFYKTEIQIKAETAKESLLRHRQTGAFPNRANPDNKGAILKIPSTPNYIMYDIKTNGNNFDSGRFTIELRYACEKTCENQR